MDDRWEIRKGGKAVVGSSMKNCGYSDETLRQLRRAGYSLYHNGVRQTDRAGKKAGAARE